MVDDIPDNCLLVREDGPISVAILNRPDRRNAINGELVTAMRTFFEARRRDAGCEVIILRGQGGHFCVGGDLVAAHEGDRLATDVLEGDWEIADILRAMR